MWIRSELKTRAKVAFQANYWKCVLVALILAVLVGGGAGSSVRKNDTADMTTEQQQVMALLAEDDHLGRLVEGMENLSLLRNSKVRISLGGTGLVGLALSILVFNPLIVGCYRFFLQNSRSQAELGELGAGFRDDWGNVVLTMFLKNLFLILWSLLFIVPGIVKAYSYRMVPYLLKEHPELKSTQAITMSRRLMNGHKWNAFVLDLSFLGWFLLSALTFGILHIFYVGPYVQATDAELYKAVTAEYSARNQVI
ncbi:MAG: DUF975 family protein [Clostridia bacterium]|nr:DUF975 family protein [Clostridia bacterium]